MHPWHPRVVSAEDHDESPDWPVAVWQKLLTDGRIPFGGHVLVIGCRHPEVVELLNEFAFDVAGVDERPAAVDAASRLYPRLQFSFAPLNEPLPAPTNDFDLVLVQDAAAYAGDLVDISPRMVTANLLSHLKPHGQLVFVRRLTGGSDLCAGHCQSCWIKHLACFPGITETASLADAWLSRETWNWLFRGEPRGSHLIVRHEAPLELLTRDAWQRCVRRGQLPGRAACCPSVASSPATLPLRRAA